MVLLIVFIGLLIFFAIAYEQDWFDVEHLYIVGITTCAACAILQIIVGFGWYGGALADLNKLRVLDEKILIVEKQQDELVRDILAEAEKYVSHEANVFKDIKPNNVQLLLTMYPQLRASETIMAGIDAISKYGEQKYKFQLDAQDLKAGINTYKQHIITFIPID